MELHRPQLAGARARHRSGPRAGSQSPVGHDRLPLRPRVCSSKAACRSGVRVEGMDSNPDPSSRVCVGFGFRVRLKFQVLDSTGECGTVRDAGIAHGAHRRKSRRGRVRVRRSRQATPGPRSMAHLRAERVSTSTAPCSHGLPRARSAGHRPLDPHPARRRGRLCERARGLQPRSPSVPGAGLSGGGPSASSSSRVGERAPPPIVAGGGIGRRGRASPISHRSDRQMTWLTLHAQAIARVTLHVADLGRAAARRHRRLKLRAEEPVRAVMRSLGWPGTRSRSSPRPSRTGSGCVWSGDHPARPVRGTSTSVRSPPPCIAGTRPATPSCRSPPALVEHPEPTLAGLAGEGHLALIAAVRAACARRHRRELAAWIISSSYSTRSPISGRRARFISPNEFGTGYLPSTKYGWPRAASPPVGWRPHGDRRPAPRSRRCR